MHETEKKTSSMQLSQELRSLTKKVSAMCKELNGPQAITDLASNKEVLMKHLKKVLVIAGICLVTTGCGTSEQKPEEAPPAPAPVDRDSANSDASPDNEIARESSDSGSSAATTEALGKWKKAIDVDPITDERTTQVTLYHNKFGEVLGAQGALMIQCVVRKDGASKLSLNFIWKPLSKESLGSVRGNFIGVQYRADKDAPVEISSLSWNRLLNNDVLGDMQNVILNVSGSDAAGSERLALELSNKQALAIRAYDRLESGMKDSFSQTYEFELDGLAAVLRDDDVVPCMESRKNVGQEVEPARESEL